MDVLRCFLAFFVPPLAVYLQEGFSRRHWWTVALTMCGIFPGIAYALYAVFTHASKPRSNPALEAALEAARARRSERAPPGPPPPASAHAEGTMTPPGAGDQTSRSQSSS